MRNSEHNLVNMYIRLRHGNLDMSNKMKQQNIIFL